MHLHFTRPTHRTRQRGSILVICLVIAGVGTIGAAAFFSLIHAKSEEALVRETAMVRRTRIANSDAMAREAMLQRCAATDNASAIESLTRLSSDWGESEIAAYSDLPLGVFDNVRLNKTGAVAHTALSTDIHGRLVANGTNHWRQFQTKTLNPALAGDLLIVETQKAGGLPAIEFTGNLTVEGRAVFWSSNYGAATASIKANRVIAANPASPKLSLIDPLDQPILPDNLPLPATTSGFVGGVPAFNGRSDLINNPGISLNDYLDTISPLSGVPLPGRVPFIESSSASTNPANSADAALLTTLSSQAYLPQTFRTDAEPFTPLSSVVLTAAIDTAQSEADALILRSLLGDNVPLPNDVLTHLISSETALSTAQLWEVIRENPVAVALDALGTAYIDLDNPASDHLVIDGEISTLILRGQASSAELSAAAGMPPIAVVIYHDSGVPLPLASVELEGANRRPFILAIKKYSDNTPVDVISTGPAAFPEWRGILDLDNVELAVDTSLVSTLTLRGGIRTNRSINISAGAMRLTPENDPLAIESLRPLASRNAWVESYAIDAPPAP